MKRYIMNVLNVAYWLAVACIPLAIEHEVTQFMVNRPCMPNSACLELAMPLIVQVVMVAWAARALLWPLAAWNLGGRWLWRKYVQNRTAKDVVTEPLRPSA